MAPAEEKRATVPGILYLARVPPYMKPEKVKSLLEQFGDVNRIYLAEEDASVAKRRKKDTNSRQKVYVEGWIEFADKKIAKSVAASLNNTPIGKVKRREYYAEDLWNLKYLKGFKWHHLTEKIAYQRRVRGQQLRMQVAASQKMHAEYMKRVEQRKAIQAIESRKRGRAEGAGATPPEVDKKRTLRQFKQRQVASKTFAASVQSETERCLLEL